MTRTKIVRRSFAVLTFSAVAAALTGTGCNGCQKTPERVDPPTILAPQPDDTVGKEFSVQGTYGNSGVDVFVRTEGAYTGSGTYTSDPSWTVPFGPASSNGTCTAYAKVTNSSENSVTFTIMGEPILIVEDSEPTLMVAAAPGGVATHNYKAKVKYKGATVPTSITVTLIRDDGKKYGPQAAQQQGSSQNWHSDFTGVEDGYYAVHAKVVVNGQTTTNTWMDKIK